MKMSIYLLPSGLTPWPGLAGAGLTPWPGLAMDATV